MKSLLARRHFTFAIMAVPGYYSAAALAAPLQVKYEVLDVGPTKRFTSLTSAGAYMNSRQGWNNGETDTARLGFRIIISPGPPHYYLNDTGSHSQRAAAREVQSGYEGKLFGPVIIEGEPGADIPVLEMDTTANGGLYNQKALFVAGSCDAVFRRLIFRGFRKPEGDGNHAAIRLGEESPGVPMHATVTVEDCEFSGCDNGIMGGAPGQSLIIRRSYFHDNGNDTGRVHNLYFSDGDLLLLENTLSTRCRIGHLIKTRAKRTVIRHSRLLGNGGTESACLDVPDAGLLEIDGLTCEKSPGSDAPWMIHYSGENQDAGNGVPFREPSRVQIRHLTMVGPSRLTRHPNWSPVLGFANQSGNGPSFSGHGSHYVPVDAQDVSVYGLEPAAAGLPCRVLPAPPILDFRSPIKY